MSVSDRFAMKKNNLYFWLLTDRGGFKLQKGKAVSAFPFLMIKKDAPFF